MYEYPQCPNRDLMHAGKSKTHAKQDPHKQNPEPAAFSDPPQLAAVPLG